MQKKITIFDISVDEKFFNFINYEVLKGLDLNENKFWSGFSDLIHEFNPINKKLLNHKLENGKKIENLEN